MTAALPEETAELCQGTSWCVTRADEVTWCPAWSRWLCWACRARRGETELRAWTAARLAAERVAAPRRTAVPGG